MIKRTRPHVAIDVTPILPGGENGGAKIMTLALVQQIVDLRSDWDFTLLTPAVCHEQLAAYEGPNLRRRCVLPAPAPGTNGVGRQLRYFARSVASRLPPRGAARLIDFYWSVRHRPRRRTIVDEIGADLLFNPFTAPLYASARVPSVSVVYDTQFAAYPQFFTAEERYGREAHLREAINQSVRLVCISDFVRQTLLQDWQVQAERVVTIRIQLADRLPNVDTASAAAILESYNLRDAGYLLYPANFWPHKNHSMLLLAFRQFFEHNPDSPLVLVCTGSPSREMDAIADAANRLGLAARCRFPGFVDEVKFAALFDHCRAVVFPSLYEGFGMPLLEAMERGRPILSSDRTALPEIGGDAALYFDPRKPSDLAAAIERIDRDAELRATLVQRGRARRGAFSNPAAMAGAYLEEFARVLRQGVAPLRGQLTTTATNARQ